ncbi:MAG: YciI family protein [Candidatus Acidiferrales bacterium]
MANFMYLFRTSPTAYRSMSPEQMQQIMKKWMDWREKLEKTGHTIMLGERLDGSGKVVRGKAKAITDGPYIELKDSVQGYMVVQAKDLEQAVEMATECPILESEGSVEIRTLLTA